MIGSLMQRRGMEVREGWQLGVGKRHYLEFFENWKGRTRFGDGCSRCVNRSSRLNALLRAWFEKKKMPIALLNEERRKKEVWYACVCEFDQYFSLHALPEQQRSARTIYDSEKQGHHHVDSSTGLQRWLKLAALVRPRRCTSTLASATERRSHIFNSRNWCR